MRAEHVACRFGRCGPPASLSFPLGPSRHERFRPFKVIAAPRRSGLGRADLRLTSCLTECHRLRCIPLHEFTAENLRIMIGQQIGLPYLIPLALEMLRGNPFTAGDLYEGDLLAAVLRADSRFWIVTRVARGSADCSAGAFLAPDFRRD